MGLTILGLGTSVPQHAMNLAEATQLALDVCRVSEREQRLLKVLYRHSGVKNRHTVLPHRIALNWVGSHSDDDVTRDDGASMGPTTRERMEFYEEHATPMACEAVQSALQQSGLDAAEITHIVTVSCTGFSAPGVDIDLIQRFGLRATTQRVNVGFMGCHGAINGMRVAQALAESDADARILLCAVECCSLHYCFHWDPDRIVGNALFADGAAAVVCASDCDASMQTDTHTMRLKATGSCLVPNSADAITWSVGDYGFKMSLSAGVPDLIEQNLCAWLTEWLAGHNLRVDDINGWAVHPGGPRILQAVGKSIGLAKDDLTVSSDVLATRGNMSSPTVLFILDRLRTENSSLPCVALGFGPGLTAEVAPSLSLHVVQR